MPFMVALAPASSNPGCSGTGSMRAIRECANKPMRLDVGSARDGGRPQQQLWEVEDIPPHGETLNKFGHLKRSRLAIFSVVDHMAFPLGIPPSCTIAFLFSSALLSCTFAAVDDAPRGPVRCVTFGGNVMKAQRPKTRNAQHSTSADRVPQSGR